MEQVESSSAQWKETLKTMWNNLRQQQTNKQINNKKLEATSMGQERLKAMQTMESSKGMKNTFAGYKKLKDVCWVHNDTTHRYRIQM